jgi:hypothetical protein
MNRNEEERPLRFSAKAEVCNFLFLISIISRYADPFELR